MAIRAEQVLGITEGDALARFCVVLLNSAERVDESVSRRTAPEKEFITGLPGGDGGSHHDRPRNASVDWRLQNDVPLAEAA